MLLSWSTVACLRTWPRAVHSGPRIDPRDRSRTLRNVSIPASPASDFRCFFELFCLTMSSLSGLSFKVKEQLFNLIFCHPISSVRDVSVALESFEFSLTIGIPTTVRKTEVRTTPARSQECECQQCEETTVRMRQKCEGQVCEGQECECDFSAIGQNSELIQIERSRSFCLQDGVFFLSFSLGLYVRVRIEVDLAPPPDNPTIRPVATGVWLE